MKENYDGEMRRVIGTIAGRTPRLLLHSCCGPCSSAVLETLTQFFAVDVLYYNPNIHPKQEYEKRLSEQKRLLSQMPLPSPVTLLDAPYDPDNYFAFVRGLENEKEGGARCEKCFEMRLLLTAKTAKAKGYDYFTTTLTVSPHKNAEVINRVGERIAKETGVLFLPSDFKKHDGYLRSLRLSDQYALYRQNYCGCIFSQPNGAAEGG